MKLMKLSIAKDFTRKPGPRYRFEGEYSGQKFREEVLEPSFKAALQTHALLEVNLNGVEGYGTSFLEESFGGLVRAYGFDKVKSTLKFISTEDESYRDEVEEYIREAIKGR